MHMREAGLLVSACLDTEVAAFRDRSLAGQAFRYLFLDATYCKARVDHRVVSQAVVVATGVAADGTVVHLGLPSRGRPLGSVVVGSCCGQAWWSALTVTPAPAAGRVLTGRCPRWSCPGREPAGPQTGPEGGEPVAASAREGTGRCPVMVVPWPGADWTSSRPLRAASRSAMFRRPDPMGVWLVS